jgi:hypothetical protein
MTCACSNNSTGQCKRKRRSRRYARAVAIVEAVMGSKLISRGVADIDVERAAHRIDELLAMAAKAFEPKTKAPGIYVKAGKGWLRPKLTVREGNEDDQKNGHQSGGGGYPSVRLHADRCHNDCQPALFPINAPPKNKKAAAGQSTSAGDAPT